MEPDNEPIPDNWYRDIQSDRSFFVTDVDTDNDLIEIQHLDGDLEQIDLGEWVELDIELAEPPEDWSGPMDRIESEDLDDGEAAARRATAAMPPVRRAKR